MAKCGKKVKNPCKLCLQPVTQKTGLQCQGACLSWVHYSCLNYTPGRISDIKRGIIKVTCPCPDCKTSYPKEYRTDEPFSCRNNMCPANQPPKCENTECPASNEGQNLPPITECGGQCRYDMSKPRPARPGSSSGGNSSSPSSGDVARGGDGLSLQVVEQLCNTVGQLSLQLNDIMTKMKQQTMKEQSGGRGVGNRGGSGGGGGGGAAPKKGSPQKGPKKNCPKPCCCTGNLAKK